MSARFSLPAVHPYLDRDVPWLLQDLARRCGDRPFLHWTPPDGAELTWSYAQLLDEARRYASGLLDRGLAPGDRVLLHMNNRPEFLAAFFGCSWAGLTAVTTNTAAAPGELRYFIEHSGARAAITEASLLEPLRRSGAGLEWVAAATKDAGDALTLEALRLSPAPTRAADPELRHGIMYTSGTTSRPKAVVYTHANMLWAAECGARQQGLRPEDIGMVFLPLFHLNALGYSTLSTMWVGAQIVLQPKFSASRFWDVARKHQATWSPMPPFAVTALNPISEPADHRFRMWASRWGGDPTISDRWGIAVRGMYGMTETVAPVIVSEPERPPPDRAIGRPTLPYPVRLVDDDGSDVPVGGTGRLLVQGIRGVSVFAEYLGDPEATAKAFSEEGWFDTGDMLTRLPDGAFRFADRQKDMMKVGGENVAASEVEAVISTVAGVREVVVVGAPHAFLTETPVACVVAEAPGPELTQRIMTACEQELARFKHPSAIRFLDELPLIGIGKVDRKALREELRQAHDPAPKDGAGR